MLRYPADRLLLRTYLEHNTWYENSVRDMQHSFQCGVVARLLAYLYKHIQNVPTRRQQYFVDGNDDARGTGWLGG